MKKTFLALTLLFLPLSSRADSPPDLNAYLNGHPALADAIRWEFPAASIPELANNTVAIQKIPPWRRLLGGFQANPVSNGAVVPKARPANPVLAPPEDLLISQGFTAVFLPPYLEAGEQLGTKWPAWSGLYKNKLSQDFAELWAWIDQCWPKYQEYATTDVKPAEFDACFSTAEPANYPPPDLQWMESPPSGISTWTVIASPTAFDLYSKMVALSLVLEIKGILPWTIAELAPSYRREILDGTLWFRYLPAGPSEWGDINHAGHMVYTTVIPAPAKLTFSFLAQNKLIGSNKLDTVTRLFTWERDNMKHTMGGDLPADCPYKGMSIYAGGYKGRMPLSRVINGTEMLCPLLNSSGQEMFFPGILHWTGGCGGTSSFNQQVLRVAQIPAQRSSYGHFQNNFVVDNNQKLWIDHADNTYGLAFSVWKGVAEIPIQEILVEDATYKSWVVDYDSNDPNLSQAQKDAYSAQNLKAVGRRPTELRVKYLPKYVLQQYCWYDQGKPPVQTKLYTETLSEYYTLAQLEAMYQEPWGTNTPGLWTNIDLKIAALGGCEISWP